MRSHHLSLVIAFAFVITSTGFLSSCRGWTTEEAPIHLNPNMDTQKKYKPYRASTFFKDGRAMRTPVSDTVPRTMAGNENFDRDVLALDDHTFTGQIDGKDELGFPADFPLNAATFKRGEDRYQVFCSPCHGADGAGKGAVAKRLPVPPPSFHQARIQNIPLGNVFQTITHGKNWPNMPSYAHQLRPEDRWAVIAYVRKLMQAKDSKVLMVPSADAQGPDLASLAGNPSALGEAIYNKTCIACHSLDGNKTVGPTFKGMWASSGKDTTGAAYVVDEAHVAESLREPNKRIREGFLPVMPPQTTMTDEEIASIVAFMKTLK